MSAGVGFFVGAGIPPGRRVRTFVECGGCGAYHRTDFCGDCREDTERYAELPDWGEEVFPANDRKRYYTQTNIGRARYVVNFHDGVKAHPDGSPFYGIGIFSNKRQLQAFIRGLERTEE